MFICSFIYLHIYVAHSTSLSFHLQFPKLAPHYAPYHPASLSSFISQCTPLSCTSITCCPLDSQRIQQTLLFYTHTIHSLHGHLLDYTIVPARHTCITKPLSRQQMRNRLTSIRQHYTLSGQTVRSLSLSIIIVYGMAWHGHERLARPAEKKTTVMKITMSPSQSPRPLSPKST